MNRAFEAFLLLIITLARSYLAEACLDVDANLMNTIHPRQAGKDVCDTGIRQSPINIDTTKCTNGEFKCDLEWFFHSGPLTMTNSGVRVDVLYTRTDVRPYISGGPLSDKRYSHLNTHFHWAAVDAEGSDHSIDGVFGPLEMHCVYINQAYTSLQEAMEQSDGICVVAIIFKLSSTDNPDLSGIMEGVNNVKAASGSVFALQNNALDFAVKEVFSEQCFYNYPGSLTTTPCSEAVNWIVMKKTVPISSAQVALFRQVVDTNGNPILSYKRDPQPLNGRKVLCSGCRCGL
ncbi:carbonic anhydrase 1-like [Neocloeon triangulifer]|uniref:carbonic anhydrase 1-like n=1 Tax=Neocloeon triangulifer TaxID=2078957 RepID=UPI00286F0FF4|nr:carbonic anhydrase 1-like [Neocloeon triangulifer]